MQELKRIATYKDFVGELTATYKRTKVPTITVKSSIETTILNHMLKKYLAGIFAVDYDF